MDSRRLVSTQALHLCIKSLSTPKAMKFSISLGCVLIRFPSPTMQIAMSLRSEGCNVDVPVSADKKIVVLNFMLYSSCIFRLDSLQ